MTYLNQAGLREAVRIRCGVPEKGDSGKERLNNIINFALRALYSDVPGAFMRYEWRLQLEPAEDTGTIDVCPTDARVFRLSTTTATWATDGTMAARWIDIQDSDEVWHTRRIRTVVRVDTSTDWGSGGTRDCVVVDRPWSNVSDTALTYRIYTREYPIPSEFQKVLSCIRDPESSPHHKMEAMGVGELDEFRVLDGWTSEGSPERWSLGDFYQLRAPHETPTATVRTVAGNDANKWGYDSFGTQHHGAGAETKKFGAAGTFSYRYCLGWGRRPALSGSMRSMVESYGATLDTLAPLYLSAPSPPTAEVTTTWGAGLIDITSADQDYIEGYGGNQDDLLSWHRSGLEKWWFRARHATENVTTSQVYSVEADEVYYLWRVEDASSITTDDRGDNDPVDVNFPLREWSGHRHIRFDRTPSDSTQQVLVRAHRTPALLEYDTDMAVIPHECLEALIVKCLVYLMGERDGNMKRRAEFEAIYRNEVVKLRRQYAFSGTKSTPMGDALGPGRRRGYQLGTIREDS